MLPAWMVIDCELSCRQSFGGKEGLSVNINAVSSDR
jgi:hypothetical protein